MTADSARPSPDTHGGSKRSALSIGRVFGVVLVVVLATTGAAMAALRMRPVEGKPAAAKTANEQPRPSYPGGRDSPSNILADSYVGPEACSRCHRENYRSWLDHPHRRMNQLASDATVLADFEDRVIELNGGKAHFKHQAPDHYALVLERPGEPQRAYRVTRTIGSRFKQFYVGVLERGAPVGKNTRNDEVVLPFGWWIAQQRWMPISYFDSYGDDVDAHGALSFDPWKPKDIAIAKVCVYCHNTMPYIYRFGSAQSAYGVRDRDLALDKPSLLAELAKRVELPKSATLPLTFQARMPLDQLVTVGISCESCHFGARAHATDDEDYRFGPQSPHLALRPSDPQQSGAPSKDNPLVVNAICRQCHSADVGSYPDGTAHTNSREAIELDAGACASKIDCTSCHNPHVAGPRHEGVDNPKQVASCTGCHDQYAQKPAAEAHAHHTLEQASCLDCHMPRITTGITRTVRSHRISSPGDPRMFAAAAPNACNVCHVDRSPAWTIAQLARDWNKSLAPDPSWAAAWGGSLENRAMDVWAKSPLQHTRTTLIDALSQRSDAESLESLMARLDDPAGTVRAFAQLALERRLGRALTTEELDVTAGPGRRALQIAALRASHGAR